ncbi:alpha-L-rhamnosidase-related protein [Parapedobacter soli]|uniref:alpha-L-rhamnosidase-related protein n=1 Tax=Parapedobacter soli TaxID=416955 RepID=UPI0021C92DD0|nr:alpha-L-rhamnosidase C-terminal domain-containing protein [Parapedobacter soli]
MLTKHSYWYRVILVLMMLSAFAVARIHGQELSRLNPRWTSEIWKGKWIHKPNDSGRDFGVYLYRKKVVLSEIPEHFVIHLSADNRYRLYINEQMVAAGPARSDTDHWFFDSMDLSPYLVKGDNVVAVQVWNMGEYAPYAQMSHRTGLIIQGESDAEEILNTDESWKVYHDDAFSPIRLAGTGTVVGPGERFRSERHPASWRSLDFDDRAWEQARGVGRGIPHGVFGSWDWQLLPRRIPMMEYTDQRFRRVVRTAGIPLQRVVIDGSSRWEIPAGTSCTILLDQGELTTAYPQIAFSQGKDAMIRLKYAEALVDENGNKGHRDHTDGKQMGKVIYDEIIGGGTEGQTFTPLWFRTFRYVKMEIETKATPLIIDDIRSVFTAYPFVERAQVTTDNPVYRDIWNVGWRTARLCAGETYYDCPYYEQLQYVGDTKIQALISLYVSGDDRLMRNAIAQFAESHQSSGLTMSRYPTHRKQIIPTFSLVWVTMLWDYWMHRPDEQFVIAYLDQADAVLSWFGRHLNQEGMLGGLPWWNFVDWAFRPWDQDRSVGGVPLGGESGQSAIISLQYAYTLQQAADLMSYFGKTERATTYRSQAGGIVESVKKRCWVSEKQLLEDTPGSAAFSQHAQIFAILCGMFSREESVGLMHRVLNDSSLTPCTYYFRFYLNRALEKVLMSEAYLSQLDGWKEMLSLGLTTFAETPEPTRSDCHAWSASPNYELLATVAGIRPASSGFRKVRIQPSLGKLTRLEAVMPHPKGEISLQLKRKGERRLFVAVSLPPDTDGVFEWGGESYQLAAGKQEFEIKKREFQ